MSGSSRPRPTSRLRQTAAVLAVVALPFTMAACADDEPVDDPGVVEEDGIEEDE